MNKKQGCFYCEQDEEFQKVLFKICDLKVSSVFLCQDQTLPGRCTIMYKDHETEIYRIPENDRNEFMNDVCVLAETIQELFEADKINYAIYGDEVSHVHFTLCPKYKGKLGWGEPFVLFPKPEDKIILSDEEYRNRIRLIEKAVKEKRGIME